MKQKKAKNRVNRLKPKDLAKMMDYINETLIKYHTRSVNEKPTPTEFINLLNKKNTKYDSITVPIAINIMEDNGYINANFDNEREYKELFTTDKGISKYIAGGFLKERKQKQNRNSLIVIVQFSATIAGLYYLLQVIKYFC